MKLSQKIKGILRSAGISQRELAILCGLSRQTIHVYLNTDIYMEDTEGGREVIKIIDIITILANNNDLPISKAFAVETKIQVIKKMIENVKNENLKNA